MSLFRLSRLGLVVCAVLLSLCIGCARRSDGSVTRKNRATIQVKGSDTMVNLAQAWAENYKKIAPDVNIEISGGGSGVGIAALIRGTIDIANASRDMKSSEIEQAKANTGKTPVEFVLGHDALAIYVHKDNPLQEISIDQLAKIYGENATVTRWSQLGITIPGVRDDRIIRVSRQNSSGTYEFFRTVVLNKRDFKLGSLDMNGSKEVVELVGNTRTAIGYSGMGYSTSHVKIIPVSSQPGDVAHPPSIENTQKLIYPLARSLHMYTLGHPQGEIQKFIAWTLSPVGQEIVQECGYVPMGAEELEEQMSGLGHEG